MRRATKLLALVLLTALPFMASAQVKKTTTIYGYAQYTGAAAAVKLTATPATGVSLPTQRPDGTAGRPRYAVITIEGGTARWIDAGGVTPTASIGTPLTGELDYDGDLVNIQFFLPSGVTMNVAYYD
jgi:hypothetical protein